MLKNGIATSDVTLLLFSYSEQTHELLSACEYFIRAGSGLPANTTEIKPKKPKTGYIQIFNTENNNWEYIADNRGQTIYNINDKSQSAMVNLGAIPADYTLLEPFEFSVWDGEKWVLDIDAKNTHTIQQNTALREQLINIANEQIIILERAIKYNRATESDKNLLEALELFTVDVSQLDLSDPGLTFPDIPKSPS